MKKCDKTGCSRPAIKKIMCDGAVFVQLCGKHARIAAELINRVE